MASFRSSRALEVRGFQTMNNYEITAGLTASGSFLFILEDFAERSKFEIREETFFYKDELKFKDISDQNTYFAEFDLIIWRNNKLKFKNIDLAKKKVLELMAEEMRTRGNIVSDKNSLYLELLKTKANVDDLFKELNELKDKVYRIDVSVNGPSSY